MLKKLAAVISIISFAFVILVFSLLRASSASYAFYGERDLVLESGQTNGGKSIQIDYFFPYEGKILPDNSLWKVKALRDRVWMTVTTNKQKRAELSLLFADKRLLASKALFEKNKAEIAFSTLTKAEKYLEEASEINKLNREKGLDTTSFELKLATASLKHRQIIEDLFVLAPEDAKPGIVKVLDYPKNVYILNRDALRAKGVVPPKNPFNGE